MKIEIENITKSYRANRVLRGVSLSLREGARIGIIGGNGSGKSTFLSILAGVRRPDSGAFLWDGRDLLSDRGQRSELVGYVPQGTPLVPELTARDNLRLWYSRDEMRKSLESGVLGMLGIGEFIKTPVSKMSGGMKKRLSIGCAMARSARLLLLDEPTAALDIVCKKDIAGYLRSFTSDGGAIIMATHDMEELAMCDRVHILRNGVLEALEPDGDMEELAGRL